MSEHKEAMNHAEQTVLNSIQHAKNLGLKGIPFNPQPIWYSKEVELRLQQSGYKFKSINNEIVLYWD